MIGASDIRRCHDLPGVAALFTKLGYVVDPFRFDPAECRAAGLELQIPCGWSLHHVARSGVVDVLLVVESGNGSSAAPAIHGEQTAATSSCAKRLVETLLSGWHRRNPLRCLVVIDLQASKRLIVCDSDSRGRVRRLTINLEGPSAHDARRIAMLSVASPDPTNDASSIVKRTLGREAVGRRFFERFRRAVDSLRGAIAAQYPDERSDEISEQALRILSRILFLCFVQEKGWLDGNRVWLFDHARRARREGHEFFSSVLRPLFFACLNTPVAQRDRATLVLGAIPYLNGGLFDRSPFEIRHPEMSIPDTLMQPIMEELFEKFDFCVDEHDLDGAHVDPEMLGRVFESLMLEDERLRSGSFYTPRAVVDILAKRAIATALAEGDQACGLAIEAAIDGGELLMSSPDLERLQSRLDRFTLLDPACGSGAFLLASMRILESLHRMVREKLGIEIPADLRRTIVERSLHGVDIKAEAVRLCELRLWLAIVSDTDCNVAEVPPLPNLDRNVMQGNSLLAPSDWLADGRREIYREWAYALRSRRDMLAEYRHARHGLKPVMARQLRDGDLRLASALVQQSLDRDTVELEQLENRTTLFEELAGPRSSSAANFLKGRMARAQELASRLERGELDFFSYDIHFAHVLSDGGFSAVIGNPPWVRTSRIDPFTRRLLTERYEFFHSMGGSGRPSFHQPDLSMLFVERALSLTKPGGVASMLVPSKLLGAAYASTLRESLARSTRIVAIDDWSGTARGLFDADTYPLGITLEKIAPPTGAEIRVRSHDRMFDVPQTRVAVDGPGSPWSVVPTRVRAIHDAIQESVPPLKESLSRTPVMGVKTGANSRFFLRDAQPVPDGLRIPGLDLTIPYSSVCRTVRGRDIARWKTSGALWMLWPPLRGWHHPPDWVNALAETLRISPSDFKLAYVRPEHVGLKVAWKDLSRGIQAVVLPADVEIDGIQIPLVPNQTVYSIDAASPEEAFAVAGLLNSTIANALALTAAEPAKDSHYRYFAVTMARIPVPRPDLSARPWRELIRLSRRAHQGSAVDEEIDDVVRSIYGVSSDDHHELRTFVSDRLGSTRP